MIEELWQIIAPDAPAPGWHGRKRYLFWQCVVILGQAMMLLGLIWLFGIYVLGLTP